MTVNLNLPKAQSNVGCKCIETGYLNINLQWTICCDRYWSERSLRTSRKEACQRQLLKSDKKNIKKYYSIKMTENTKQITIFEITPQSCITFDGFFSYIACVK